MSNIAGFPHFEVQFTKDGQIYDPNEVTAGINVLKQNNATDLFVFAHGWNNDMDDARELNQMFFGCVRHVLDSGAVDGLVGRQFGVLTVLWPSKKFADEELIASGAAGVASVVSVPLVQAQLESLKGAFAKPGADAVLEEAKKLVPQLEDSASARRDFAERIRALMPPKSGDREDASDSFFKLSGEEVLKRLGKPVMPAVPPKPAGHGGATALGAPAGPQGHAAGVGQFFSGVLSGARNLLNYTTYYQMKERAGLVGSTGVNQVLRQLRGQFPGLRIHLIGHSFGGRLVTAAADALGGEPALRPNSLTLLQAAFSHNGFASRYDGAHDGFFRTVVTGNKVSGPVLITCSKNDRAVGIAYPLASLIAGQNAAALGDANDPYGGIGRNGAQKTPEAVDGLLVTDRSPYSFEAGKLYNLNADATIAGHSDICKNEVAYAVLAAVVKT